MNLNLGLSPEMQADIARLDARIGEFNNNLNSGIKVAPETREAITNVADKFSQFNKSGVLGEEGLLLAKKLMDLLEQGVRVGLDEATIDTANSFGGIINAQPEKWQQTMSVLIDLLGVVGSDLSSKIAQDLSSVETQVAHDITGVVQDLGTEARCTVDYAGNMAQDTITTAGAKFVSGLLPQLKKLYGQNQTAAQIPGVCTIAPYELNLVWIDGALVPKADAQLIHISGFNISNQNLPAVFISPEDETKSPYNIPLTPVRETSYRMTIDLQGKSFASVTPGSKLIIRWSESIPDLTFRKSILVQSPVYAGSNFTASTTRGEAPLTVKFFDQSSGEPETYFWNFGDGATSSEKQPTHIYDRIGVYSVTLTVDNEYKKPNSLVMPNLVTVVAPPPPVASFDAQPTTGQGPLDVSFTDRSTGNPVSRTWDFGDGQSSTAESTTHKYDKDGNYTASLTVRNAYGATDARSVAISVLPTPTPPPTPKDTPTTEPQPVYSYEDFLVNVHADSCAIGPCRSKNINQTYTVAAGWIIDRSKGDPDHPGIQQLEVRDNKQSESTLRGYNYLPMSDSTVNITGQIRGSGGWGPGAIFDRRYRVFIVKQP